MGSDGERFGERARASIEVVASLRVGRWAEVEDRLVLRLTPWRPDAVGIALGGGWMLSAAIDLGPGLIAVGSQLLASWGCPPGQVVTAGVGNAERAMGPVPLAGQITVAGDRRPVDVAVLVGDRCLAGALLGLDGRLRSLGLAGPTAGGVAAVVVDDHTVVAAPAPGRSETDRSAAGAAVRVVVGPGPAPVLWCRSGGRVAIF